MTLVFRVYGLAQTKGNMRAVPVKGRAFPAITDANRSVAAWQQQIARAASEVINGLPYADRQLLVRGVRLSVAFYLPRPKKYQKAGCQVAHLTKPDTSKLLRAAEDALTGVAYLDDAQIVELLATKSYAPVNHPPYVDIRVEATNGVFGELAPPAAPLPLLEALR